MSLIARLIEAGTPPELIEEVALLMAEKRVAEAAIEKRRSNDRDRTNRKRGNVTSRDTTGHDVTERDPAPSLSSPQTPQQSHPHPDTKPRARKGASTPAKPDDVSGQVWADFLIHRKEKDAPVTETVLAGYRAEAAKAGISLQAAMETSITQGWQGFRAGWLKSDERRNGAPASGGQDPLIASIIAKKARADASLPP